VANADQFRAVLERHDHAVLKALITVAARQAARGDMRALGLLLDRAYGRPTNEVHVDTGPSLRELILGGATDDER
jgi:hypothetical protein